MRESYDVVIVGGGHNGFATGNVFHRALAFPYRAEDVSGRWRVETAHAVACG